MNRTLVFAALALTAGTAFAASTVTEEWRVNLVRTGGTTQGTYTGATIQEAVANCRKALITTVSREYDCQTPRLHLVVTVTPDTPPPPSPIDCAVSGPVDTATDWSPALCPSSGKQTRTVTSTLTVTRQPANGGAICQSPLITTKSEEQSCTYIPPVDPQPTGQVITVTAGQSISSAVSQLQPGGTVVIKPGTYGAFNLKACTAAAWCTVKAETDGTVLIAGLAIGKGNWYTRIEGLKFTGTDEKTVRGSYLKFLRNAFMASVTIGTNDWTPGASNVLVEDSWVYGPGQRYKFLVYNAENVVLRRLLVRHDGGYVFDGRNPSGGISLYDSRNVACQDCMFLDPAPGLQEFEAAIYLISNGTTATKQSNVSVTGAVIIGSPNNGLAAEGNGSAATYNVSDIAIAQSAGGLNTNNTGHVLNATRVYASVSGTAFARWASSGSLKVTDCVVPKSGTVSSGASLTRCPGGARADLSKRIGVSGTLYGEAGYDTVLEDPLWPYPNEERIKADFDAVRAAFGGRSLTGYVQGATP